MNIDKWAVIRVLCSDGVERVGMIQEETVDLTESRIIVKGLGNEKLAQHWVLTHAVDNDMEIFDNNIHEEIEI
jgi:hypothetical protein